MAGFLKSLFGDKKEADKVRHLSHPRELAAGDIVKFKLFTPAPLAGNSFTVDEVNTYDFKSGNETEFVLRGSDKQTLFMTVDESDDEVELRLSVKIPRTVVEQLFELDQFAGIFDADELVRLERTGNPENFDPQWSWLSHWSAAVYTQNAKSVRGYFHKGDYRQQPLSNSADGADELDYYSLISDDEKYYIEIEVYDGDTDVMVTRLFEANDIEELWPST